MNIYKQIKKEMTRRIKADGAIRGYMEALDEKLRYHVYLRYVNEHITIAGEAFKLRDWETSIDHGYESMSPEIDLKLTFIRKSNISEERRAELMKMRNHELPEDECEDTWVDFNYTFKASQLADDEFKLHLDFS